VSASFSCQDGFCGSCETRVLEGTPEHRDSVLTEGERAENKVMMICVSGCRGEGLVLDL
jgi:ferredoxin